MEPGPHMMIVGDMRGLALNKGERQHGFECKLSPQQVGVWIYCLATLLITSILTYPALI